jgi:hypothetical protein
VAGNGYYPRNGTTSTFAAIVVAWFPKYRARFREEAKLVVDGLGLEVQTLLV